MNLMKQISVEYRIHSALMKHYVTLTIPFSYELNFCL